MQSQSKQNKNHSSPGTGKAINGKFISKQKNGDRQTSANAAINRGIGFHVLAKELKTISLFEISMLADNGINEDSMLFKIIDTEAKQLQAIEDLYLIVKAQPRYKNLNEPDWKLETRPITILQWLLRKLGPLAAGNTWTIDTYNDNGKTRYRFVVYKSYSTYFVNDGEIFMPLDFLPMLKHRDKELHDMIIDIVALTSRENKIPLWDMDGDFSEAIQQILSSPESHNDIYETQKKYYRTGPPASYLRMIKMRRRTVTAEEIKKKINIYLGGERSGRQNSMAWWIRHGLTLAETKGNVSPFTYIPNYEVSQNPIGPHRLYKYVWSKHQHDIVRIKAYKKVDKHSSTGLYLPIQFSIAYPGKVLKMWTEDRFPVLLASFLASGVQGICYTYGDYFFKKDYRESKAPGKTLLEIFNKEELKHL